MRKEVRKWLRTIDWDVEITLTFSNDLSRQAVEKALKRFWNRVDSQLYGNAAKRFGRRCQRLNVIEGDGELRRYHLHILAKLPTDRFATITGYSEFLRDQWLLDNPKNFIASFSPIRDREAYSGYATKHVQRDNCDALILDSSFV